MSKRAYPPDLIEQIIILSKRVAALENGFARGNRSFHATDGTVLFTVKGTTGQVGFFGSEAAQQSASDLSGVIGALSAYGLLS